MRADLEGPDTAAPTLTVLIADDDPLVRAALRDAIEASYGIRILAEVTDGRAALAKALELRPDIVLLDVWIPQEDAFTVTRRLRMAAPEVQVVVLATTEDDELGLLGLRAGAAGFLLKDVTDAALVRALRGIGEGEAAVSRALSLKLVEYLRQAPEPGDGMRPVWSTLTSREWQVLDLLCQGATTDELAQRLGLTSETVRSHVKHILHKLGAHSRREAIEAANRLRGTAPGGLEDAYREVARRSDPTPGEGA